MYEELQKRIIYEKMLAGISEQAVSVRDLDLLLQESLKCMGNTLDVSRIFIFYFQIPEQMFFCRCRWDAREIGAPAKLDETPLYIPWAAQQLMRGKILNFESIQDFPDERYREWLFSINVKSTLNVPLFIKSVFYGFMGFDECRYHRKWVDEDIYILSTAAQIITRAIENKTYEEELKQHRNLLESIFRSVQDAIITVDTLMNVIESNKAAEQICNIKMIPGRPFTDCMRGCDKSCLQVLKETLATHNIVSECQIKCGELNKRKKIAVVNCSPLLDGNGSFVGAVLVIKEVTRLIYLEEKLKGRQQYQNIIGKSQGIQRIYSLIETLAPLMTTVLITGESGTGKEVFARALHNIGPRADKPFVAVNCSALPEALLENELFGHVKGAFSGAENDAIGRFETANGGTILLDEIGDVSPLMQLKLLRVLQEREFERLGESKVRKLNVRVIASTNRDLKNAIKTGSFREDLYYRLNVINIRIPPLRERYEDVPLLIDHFCRKLNESYQKNIRGISSEVLEAFLDYTWPGNIRELEHAMESAFVLCQNHTIQLSHIPVEIRERGQYQRKSSSPDKIVHDSDEMLAAMESTDWNISKAARILKISRWTVYRRLKMNKISRPPEIM